ncbi:60S ribosomal protein L7, putative [Ricinus communis]|uniref:60S ribosomal protein L7, putative n=1 Tax=Ricinus communis TaxID=3988 RepID=B9SZL7_RICCO|nr:60S ribosomal protein L7, putative [Ricinus communis]
MLNNQGVPLIDNNIVEQALGKFGILCLEDIIHEIANVGPHFKDVNNFLGPFALSKPKGGLQGKKALFKDGGDTGNHVTSELQMSLDAAIDPIDVEVAKQARPLLTPDAPLAPEIQDFGVVISMKNARALIGVKRMGELDNRPFFAAAKRRFPDEEANVKAAERMIT